MPLSLSIRFGTGLMCVIAAMLLGTLSGCGGSSAPATPQVTSTPVLRPTGPVAVPKQIDRPAAGNPAQKGNSKESTSSGQRNEKDPFADEDPKNRFEIAEAGSNFTIPPAGDDSYADRFVVGAVSGGGNSSQFEVGTPERDDADGANGRGGAATSESTGNRDFDLPEGFAAVASFGMSSQGLPNRIRDEKTGSLMALVPGGLAHVGSGDGPEETQPEFSPFLETYYMDVTEVTLGAYAKFRDDQKQKKNTRVQSPLNEGQDDRLPAVGLAWGVAQGFAHWAGKELPTEAEFEKAARGPDGFRTPWGHGRAVWPKPRTQDQITTVGAFPTDQSVYGIFDLAGNAREWCSDWYGVTAHQDAAKLNGQALKNWAGPKKPTVTGQRVVKGNGPDWSAWHRQGRAMNDRAADVGFRCVLRVKVSQPTEASSD